MTRPTDVLVVGGGVVGCAVAFGLAREGLSVRLLERDELARHASGAAAGMLLPFGESEGEGAFLAWATRSLASFPALCAELRERSGIDPELEPTGALHVATTASGEARLIDKAQRLSRRGAVWLDAREAREVEPVLAPATRGALFCESEAHVRSPLLVRAYAGAATSLGARIECGVGATGLRRRGERVVGVDTPAGPREAGCVVVCAGAWSPALAPLAGGARLPVEPVRGQILSLDNPRPPLRRIVVGEEAYLVPKRDDSVVVGATEERVGFDCRVTAAGMQGLLAAAPRLVPALGDCGFRGGWAGLRPTSPDGLPLVGPLPGAPGLFVAAGHHRNGVLLSPVTGALVAALVLGKAAPEDAATFRPDRFAA